MHRAKKRTKALDVTITKESAGRRVIDSGTLFTFNKNAPLWFHLKSRKGPKLSVKLSFEEDENDNLSPHMNTKVDERSRTIFLTLINCDLLPMYKAGHVCVENVQIAGIYGEQIFLSFSATRPNKNAIWQVDYCFSVGKKLKHKRQQPAEAPTDAPSKQPERSRWWKFWRAIKNL